MYYEEKCVNGVWWWRGLPNGEWLKFSYIALQNKLNAILAEQSALQPPSPPLEAQRDAERYRWLRNSGGGKLEIRAFLRSEHGDMVVAFGPMLDAAIDAAMQETTK